MIESERNRLRKSKDGIRRLDYGAGSLLLESAHYQKVSQIASVALSHPFQCRFMARLVHFAKAKTILEFGTSLGISTAYLAASSPSSSIVTIEGDPEIAGMANQVFNNLGIANVKSVVAEFSSFLEKEGKDLPPLDIVFLDGHHTSTALLTYTTALWSRFHEGTIIIVDDIHWSQDMYNGWQTLIHRAGVTQSVDCFHFGLIFFSLDFLSKEHHTIHLPFWSQL